MRLNCVAECTKQDFPYQKNCIYTLCLLQICIYIRLGRDFTQTCAPLRHRLPPPPHRRPLRQSIYPLRLC